MAKVNNTQHNADVDKFLRENDPTYLERNKGKDKGLEYSFHSPDQERLRARKEIPASSLSMKQKLSILGDGTLIDDIPE